MQIAMYPARVRGDDNPFISILTQSLASVGMGVQHYAPGLTFGTPHVLHVHWLEAVFWGRIARRLPFAAQWNASRLISTARKVSASGGKIVWTVHNLAPHEGLPPSQNDVWQRLNSEFLPLVTDVIIMSADVEADVRLHYPQLASARFHAIAHPHYVDFFKAYPRRDIRRELALAKGIPLYACVGKVRPYKQIVEMIRMLQADHADPFKLIIAGDGSQHYSASIAAAIAGDGRFYFDNRQLSHADVASYLAAADVAIFNFRRILNSGSVLTALSLGTPVVSPASGALADLASLVGPQWMRCYQPPLTGEWLAKTLAELSDAQDEDMASLGALSPERIARSHLAIYTGQNT